MGEPGRGGSFPTARCGPIVLLRPKVRKNYGRCRQRFSPRGALGREGMGRPTYTPGDPNAGNRVEMFRIGPAKIRWFRPCPLRYGGSRKPEYGWAALEEVVAGCPQSRALLFTSCTVTSMLEVHAAAHRHDQRGGRTGNGLDSTTGVLSPPAGAAPRCNPHFDSRDGRKTIWHHLQKTCSGNCKPGERLNAEKTLTNIAKAGRDRRDPFIPAERCSGTRP